MRSFLILKSDDSRVVDKTIEALEAMESEAAPAVPALAAKLSTIDSNRQIHYSAVGQARASAQAAVPCTGPLIGQ